MGTPRKPFAFFVNDDAFSELAAGTKRQANCEENEANHGRESSRRRQCHTSKIAGYALSKDACAAARRAVGTRKGEQLT